MIDSHGAIGTYENIQPTPTYFFESKSSTPTTELAVCLIKIVMSI